MELGEAHWYYYYRCSHEGPVADSEILRNVDEVGGSWSKYSRF